MTKKRKEKKRDRPRGERKTARANPAQLTAGSKVAVEVLKKDPNLRRVSVAGTTVAILPVSAVESLGISEGSRWSDEQARRIADATDAAKARKTAMKLLSKRGLSRDDVRDRLKKRGYSEAIAAQVVTDLESHGWIDEKAVAESVVRETARKGPASGDFVRRKLRDRKVEDVVADRAASSAGVPAGIADAEQFARKRLAKMDAELKPSTKARRIARALSGRGFDDDTISTILNRIDLGGIEADD